MGQQFDEVNDNEPKMIDIIDFNLCSERVVNAFGSHDHFLVQFLSYLFLFFFRVQLVNTCSMTVSYDGRVCNFKSTLFSVPKSFQQRYCLRPISKGAFYSLNSLRITLFDLSN